MSRASLTCSASAGESKAGCALTTASHRIVEGEQRSGSAAQQARTLIAIIGTLIAIIGTLIAIIGTLIAIIGCGPTGTNSESAHAHAHARFLFGWL